MLTNTIEAVIEDRVFGVVQADPMRVVPSTSNIDIARMVQRGMDGAYLQRLCERIPRQLLADTLGAETSNFAKFYKRWLSKVQTDQINDLTLIWSELCSVFEDDSELLDEWLNTPIPALSGAAPIELLTTIVGRQSLRQTLLAMRYGEFA